MKQDEIVRLLTPICQLTGYCRSASGLEPDSRLKEWGEKLIELAEKLDAAWEEITRPGDAAS